jgi:hypothetical protein
MNDISEFNDFIERQNLDEPSKELLVQSTKRIMQRTELLGKQAGSNCQLVVGEVQSGKTMSFTSLVALAHDNGFPLVVVLAGTKDQLLSQTAERLIRDLKADGNGGPNSWLMLVKPKKKDRSSNLKKLQRSLSIWKQESAPKEFKSTVVISILKNRTSLDEVNELISGLRPSFEINDYPVLIIDDEGDQAGLNLSWLTEEESTVYAAISRLRKNLARHSYVMYTATPQGPLLINIADTLSPKYVTLLSAGKDYLSGEDLFVKDSDFIKRIPESERNEIFDTSSDAVVPKSLKEALAFYLLSLYVAQKRSNPKPLSMLIHPSAQKSFHSSYANWVNKVLASWEMVFQNPTELVYESLKRDLFIPALSELSKTVSIEENFDLDSALKTLPWWITSVEVREINSDKSDIDPRDWLSHPGWILIGGNKLERGFTIENLAVTYMPRSTGVGNVDVIQQRGRFFGYKRKYKDLLRGWFFEDHIQAYISYVDHEKSIRAQLREVDQKNEKLWDWRRRFLLDPSYQPVRNQVISLGISHKRLSTFKQHMLFDSSLAEESADFFIQRVKPLIRNEVKHHLDSRESSGNFVCEIELDTALNLLADWPMSFENRNQVDDIIWAIQALGENVPSKKVALVLMDWDVKNGELRPRERTMLNDQHDPSKNFESQMIGNLYQGPSKNYPGDSEMKISSSITIQVHKVEPVYEGRKLNYVTALALIMPPNTRGFVIESRLTY